MVHEMLQEISEFFVLREAGLSVRRALVMNFLASATILIGALGSYFLLERFESVEVPLLGLAVGSYLIVIFHDLIPHSLESARLDAHYMRHIVFFLVGAALMMGVAYALPHEESSHEPQAAVIVTKAH
ncbi:MAG: ZIP family metal transporter [Minisyncoccota bacterium]